MQQSEFQDRLRAHPEAQLRFELPDGGLIEAHAHITEVGRVDRSFIDCGGTIRRISVCNLQAWVADDVDHRLSPGKLARVLDLAAPLFHGEDLPVEIEYEDGLISQFPVLSAEGGPDGVLRFVLGSKHTDCLAKDVCLPPQGAGAASSCCTPGGGCC